MAASRKGWLPKFIDLPLLVGLLLTAAYYGVMALPAMHGTLLHTYTTEHAVEYVIMAFFLWGLADTGLRIAGFPREFRALKQQLLVRRAGREPVSRAGAYVAALEQQPGWLRDSRLGRRFLAALEYLDEKGSAEELAGYLRHLSDQDYERTQSNYALLRFICWVTPMFGFLGTVVHFGTALGGQSAGDLGDKLPKVVAEMGTAFNTTTVALTAATTMMFCVFICERIERSIVNTVDERADRELMNRFEMTDANLVPFLGALRETNQITLDAVSGAVAGHLRLWSETVEQLQRHALEQHQRQAQLWAEALGQMETHFEQQDLAREQRLGRVLAAFDADRQQQVAHMHSAGTSMAALQGELARFVDTLSQVVGSKGELVALQASLAENLRVLSATQQMDQALNALTGAIHLITARQSSGKDLRAA